MSTFKEALKSQSYAVQGSALVAISLQDPAQALTLAKTFEKDNKANLTLAMVHIYATAGSDAEWPFTYKQFVDAGIQSKFSMVREFANMTGAVKKPEYAQQGISAIKDAAIKFKPYGVAPALATMLDGVKAQRTKMGDTASAAAADEAIKEINK